MAASQNTNKITKGVRFSNNDDDYVPTKKPNKGRVLPEHKKFSFAPTSTNM